MPKNPVAKVARDIARRIKPYAWRVEIAGSIRRRVRNPSDIDILVIPKRKNSYYKIGELMATMGAARISVGPKRTSVLFRKELSLQIDFVFTSSKAWGAALMYFTGPAGANIWNRQLAKSKGYILNQYGLFNRKTGKQVPVYSERTIYQALGKSYREPWERGKPR